MNLFPRKGVVPEPSAVGARNRKESPCPTRTNVMKGTMRIRFYEDESRVVNLKVE